MTIPAVVAPDGSERPVGPLPAVVAAGAGEVTRCGIRVVAVDRRGRGLLSACAEFPTTSEAMDHLAAPSGD